MAEVVRPYVARVRSADGATLLSFTEQDAIDVIEALEEKAARAQTLGLEPEVIRMRSLATAIWTVFRR